MDEPESSRPIRLAASMGCLGAALIGLVVMALVLLAAAMSHCSDCDMSPYILRGFASSVFLASIFGLFVGLIAWSAATLLPRLLRGRQGFFILGLMTLGLVMLAAPNALYALMALEEWWERPPPPPEPCPDPGRRLALIHDELPTPLPRGTFVAEVDFAGADSDDLYRQGIRGRVLRIHQGERGIESLLLLRYVSDPCDEPLSNGRKGIVVAAPRYKVGLEPSLNADPLLVRRDEGFRLPSGFQLPPPPKPTTIKVKTRSEPVVTVHAENGVAVATMSSGEAIEVPSSEMPVPVRPKPIEATGRIEKPRE